MQRPNENTSVHTQCFRSLLLCCWFQLNGYRGSADQTHAALIIMCVCCVSVCIHARPFCSHYAGNPITTQSSKGGDVDECRSYVTSGNGPCFYLALFCFIFVYFGAPWRRKYSIRSSIGLVFSRNHFVDVCYRDDESQQ